MNGEKALGVLVKELTCNDAFRSQETVSKYLHAKMEVLTALNLCASRVFVVDINETDTTLLPLRAFAWRYGICGGAIDEYTNWQKEK